MQSDPIRVLLADDDNDDNIFFQKAILEIPFKVELSIVKDGEELMEYLGRNIFLLPHILFLDLSMPRKNGIECLVEIKEDIHFKNIYLVIFSTSFPSNEFYEDKLKKTLMGIGAEHFIRKPNSYEKLKNVIYETLLIIKRGKSPK